MKTIFSLYIFGPFVIMFQTYSLYISGPLRNSQHIFNVVSSLNTLFMFIF